MAIRQSTEFRTQSAINVEGNTVVMQQFESSMVQKDLTSLWRFYKI